jgi:hypothetical protein
VIEYIVVDHPAVYPNACFLCGAGKGPMVDTHVEKPVAGGDQHLYLCRMCVTRGARVFGLVKGEKMDELLHAAEGLEQKATELAALGEELTAAKLEAASGRATVAQQKTQLQDQAGRLQVMARIATELERQTRELTEIAVGPQQVSQVAM